MSDGTGRVMSMLPFREQSGREISWEAAAIIQARDDDSWGKEWRGDGSWVENIF